MDCPKCNNLMKEGFVYLGGTQFSSLGWSEKEPYAFKVKKSDKNKTILKASIFHLKKKHWLRESNHCECCDLYLFSNK